MAGFFDDRIGPSDARRDREHQQRWYEPRRWPEQRSAPTPPDEGFSRRGGWRPGSDYYGDRAERFEPMSYRGQAQGWRDEPDAFGRSDDYGEHRGRRRHSSAHEESRERESRDPNAERWHSDDDRYGAWGSLAGALGIGRSEGHRGRGPRGFKRSDNRIHDDVCDRLTEDPGVDATNVDVQVKEGEVTLSGSVNSRMEKRRAEDLIERVWGVRDVHNRLKVVNEAGRSEPGTQSTAGTQMQSSAWSRQMG